MLGKVGSGMERLMTLNEFAKYVQLHVMTVYRLVRLGKIPYYKVGGRYRFSRSMVDEMIEPANICHS